LQLVFFAQSELFKLMKNNFFYFFFSFLFFIFINFNLSSKELEINAFKINLNNKNKTSILEGSVSAVDEKGNKLLSDYAEYDKIKGLFKTLGDTKVLTSAGFEVLGSDIFLDDNKKIIYSNNTTQITDKDGNKIFVEMFNYSTLTNIFFSKGNIKVTDVNNNTYNFSEIYIDEKKEKIIGSDIRAFLKAPALLVNKKNEPRFFANTMSLSKNINTFEKGIFTYCKNREGEKCPPWILQSKKINHDLAKKTIYYDNVILKVYDFPIFFAPKFSHPDPTVDRMSGFLAPSLTNSNTVGTGFGIPYFWNISNNKDLTVTPRLYLNENPLLLAEYRHDFKNSFFIVDTSYTQGYKKTNNKKSKGGRAHFFANFDIGLIDEEEKYSNLQAKIEKVSNDTYLKIYDIKTSLVDKDKNILENSIDFNYQNKDFYFSISPSAYENINEPRNSRYEYVLPANIEKNLFTSEKYGFLDLNTNLKIRNYEINKQTNFLVNEINWESNKWMNKLGFKNYFAGLIKNVNYDSKNTSVFKDDQTNIEAHPAIGYFAKLGLFKRDVINENLNTFTPRFLLRYAPSNMRKIDNGNRLSYENLFNLNKINEFGIVEDGLSTSIGFEFKKNKLSKDTTIGKEIFSFSAGQVINDKENINIPSRTSLDQQFSDIVGKSKYNINKNINLNYNFSLDQNYKNFNYNEIGGNFNFEKTNFNVAYLQEKNHIGNLESISSGIDYKPNDSTELSFSSKRNLLTSSAEFYNLSYNYINDCLKAGIGYRREFYTDRDVEPTNTLMFTISIIPFAQINSPGFSK
jgi:LPS-assembly protein